MRALKRVVPTEQCRLALEFDPGEVRLFDCSAARLSVLSYPVKLKAYRNQAPTPVHPTHHVYVVYVAPFAARPFVVGESINGGHAEMGGSTALSVAELLAWEGWAEHFALSGCDWAVPLVEAGGVDERASIDAVVRGVCRRADTDDSDVPSYEWKRRH